MTRINVIPVQELSDAWLLAEYRELPRVIKQDINISDAPEKYKLGTGHVKWAKKHSLYCCRRYIRIYREMSFRTFKTNYKPVDLIFYILSDNKKPYNDYQPTQYDINLNRQRLIERYNANPKAHRWTGRNKPEWIK